MPKLIMPPAWKVITAGERSLECEATSVGQALASLFERFPELRQRVLNREGQVVSYVTIFLADRDIRDLQGLKTPVDADATISIVPAIVGG